MTEHYEFPTRKVLRCKNCDWAEVITKPSDRQGCPVCGHPVLDLEPAAALLCDFCSKTPVVLEFECKSFETGSYLQSDGNVIHEWSDGNWLACDTCAKAVILRDESELLHQSLMALNVTPKNEVATAIALRRLHKMFFENMTGSTMPAPRAG